MTLHTIKDKIIYGAECRIPTACRFQPMPNADGIGQPALDGIENVNFWGFWAQNHQKLSKKYILLYMQLHFWLLLYPQNINQKVEPMDNFSKQFLLIISGCYPKKLLFYGKFQCRRNAEFRRHWGAECRMPTALEIPGISPSIV